MQNIARAQLDSANPLPERRHWVSSGEALRLVTAVYDSHDCSGYGSDEERHWKLEAQAAEAMLRRLVCGSLLARPVAYEFSRLSDEWESEITPLDEPHGTIPKYFWQIAQRRERFAKFDWIAGDFSFEANKGDTFSSSGYAHGVLFDRACLPAIVRDFDVGTEGAVTSITKRKTSGAPRKWDWDGALLHLAALAHHGVDGLLREDGSEPNQSDIARHLQAWFVGTCDQSPEDSQLRQYGRRFLDELNALKSQDANKMRQAG